MRTCKLLLNAFVIALSASIASVSHGATPFDPALQPYGTLPPLSITGFNLSGGTQKAFQVWFDGYNWAGDVVAYPLGTDGRTDTSTRLWSASDVFQSKQACGNGSPTDPAGSAVDWFDTTRKVVTRNTFGSNKPFRWASIPDHHSSIGDATEGPKILNYIRGDRINEKENIVKDGTGTIIKYECGISSGTMRPRTSILGRSACQVSICLWPSRRLPVRRLSDVQDCKCRSCAAAVRRRQRRHAARIRCRYR